MNKATKKILTIYLNYKDKAEKNTKMEQKKLKIAEKEKASRPKKVYKRNRKKERFRKLIRSRVLPRRGFSSSEFTSSDSITGKSMSVAIFDLTLNERMNWLAWWMKHIGRHVNFHSTFFQHLPKILSNMLDKMLDRFN